ncbi:MAG: tyrosine-type recombinase/integrase [Candidatus Bathyarchaeota archaeon]|nr:tyrosine-type recombinase/integrase [Candidatus Bathyarchaeota archaeon]MDH5747085.1 tyrosine-type recombinase/integrase [Candidatus Bathyarchaeota archaeon]
MTKLDDDPSTNETRNRIINTLLKCKNSGLAESTLKSIASSFRQISQNADLNNPESVKAFIANLKLSNNTKQKHANNYNYYCKANGIKWEKPYYRAERKIPLIPTTENVNKIISASSNKYATIFTILKETGLEGMELATIPRNQIDADRGIINAEGCKGHNSRSCKLKQATADLLRTYLAKYKGNYPFPRSKIMGQMWREFRDRLAEKLNDPQLKAIPLRNLRHYYATRLYAKTKDILLVKQRLGHKKLETTMFYTQLIHYNEEEEYTCKAATNIKEATELIENGFQYVTEMDGLKLFRKRK